MKPPMPVNEKARLKALRSLNILDTAPEEDFDDITFLASHICRTPIALITLVDENRQWFKSKIGIDVQETSRDSAFCAHVIAPSSPEIFLVGDALRDERFAENPLVTGEPRIRFYAGAPLLTAGNEALGTICVIDREPRELTEDQKKALEALARQVSTQLKLRQLSAQFAEANQELQGLSLTDDLTGLLNRRGFMFHAEQQLKLNRTPRGSTGLVLVYADMDGLKQTNDVYGHGEGSAAIAAIGEILKQSFRQSDIIARLGGDEFTVLAINADKEGGRLVAARLQEKISERNEKDGKPYDLGLSVGTILIEPGDKTPIEELMAQADAAMYENKASKRA